MFELEPQAWTIHLLVLGLINIAAIGAVALVILRQKEQWKEISRFREQCRRIEEHLMSLRRTMAAQKQRENEAPASETNEVAAA